MVNENEYIEIVKKYFIDNLPEFHLKHENSHGPFWSVTFASILVQVIISGDIGFQIEVEFYGETYPLWQSDLTISSNTATNHNNLNYQLNVLNNLLKGLK